MEPLTILSLTSGLVQLVDFTAGVVRESYELAKSAGGKSKECQRLAELEELNSRLCDNILRTLDANQPLQKDDADLRRVVEMCKARLDKLNSLLQKLTVDVLPDGSMSKRQSIKVAFNAHSKRAEIEAMVKDVESVQCQVGTRLLYLIRCNQILQHDELFSCIGAYGIKNANAISTVRCDLLAAIEQQREELQRTHQGNAAGHKSINDAQIQITKDVAEIRDALFSTDASINQSLRGLTTMQNAISQQVSRLSTFQRCQTLAASLSFQGIDHRKDMIAEIAENTCDWIFDQSACSFKSWLHSNAQLYCIFEKAGSGKSTLMKALSHDVRLEETLNKWRPSSTLILADHYFWYPSANALQKTHSGLLRSLLHAIISIEPTLAPCLCPQRWARENNREPIKSWSRQELLRSLQNVRLLSDAKIFLLIDGLDEYYPHDDHRLLIKDLRTLLQIPNVKLCVSSRPWAIFEKSFHDVPALRLEEFNASDIWHYAKQELRDAAQNANWRGLRDISDDRNCEHEQDHNGEDETNSTACAERAIFHLAREVKGLANGVFLWVHLVVAAMTERLRAGSNLDQLRHCLHQFPEDLEEYFENMIYNRISSTWREGGETAQVLKLATMLIDSHRSYDVSNFLCFWFACQGNVLDKEDFAFSVPIKHVSDLQMDAMVGQTTALLKHSAGDLLCLRPLCDGLPVAIIYDMNVDFTHRSAYDFITTARMQTLLDERVPSHFHHPTFLSRLMVLSLKVRACPDSIHDFLDWVSLQVSITWADKKAPVDPTVLTELDRIIALHIVESFSGRSKLNKLSRPSVESLVHLLSTPISHGYTQSALCTIDAWHSSAICDEEKGVHAYTLKNALLASALGVAPNLSCCFTPEAIDGDLLRSLLNGGANPNWQGRLSSVQSPWQLFLRAWVRRGWAKDFNPNPAQSIKTQRSNISGIDRKIWQSAKALIEKDADLEGNVCVRVDNLESEEKYRVCTCSDSQECRRFPVLDLLNACVPDEIHFELLDCIKSAEFRNVKRSTMNWELLPDCQTKQLHNDRVDLVRPTAQNVIQIFQGLYNDWNPGRGIEKVQRLAGTYFGRQRATI